MFYCNSIIICILPTGEILKEVDYEAEEPESTTHELTMFDCIKTWTEEGVTCARGEQLWKPAHPDTANEIPCPLI